MARTAFSALATITRPANTTAYPANDIVGEAAAAIQFNFVGMSGGGEMFITSSELMIAVAAIPSGMTSFRLYLYSATPPSAAANNDAFDIPAGDRTAFLGYIDLGSPVDLGSTLFVQTDQTNKQVRVPPSGDLFGYLVTNGGFTPAGNSEVYTITLHGIAG